MFPRALSYTRRAWAKKTLYLVAVVTLFYITNGMIFCFEKNMFVCDWLSNVHSICEQKCIIIQSRG